MCQQRFLAASQNSEQEADVLMTANVEKLSQHVAALQQQLQVVTEEAVTSHAAAARAQAEVRELEGRMFKNEEKIKALRDFVFYYKKELRTVHNEKAMWQVGKVVVVMSPHLLRGACGHTRVYVPYIHWSEYTCMPRHMR
ncbi:hypothetical protein Vafri_3654 [Volvox africanus]|uniref:Uncharacterized protein n=1 Tax=Volvox africanus TaxID=51714 RepID=A0A8J4ET27_9CHLO|nr:hypothetical protein Vafri_3654 [Volvox africanus]